MVVRCYMGVGTVATSVGCLEVGSNRGKRVGEG